MKTEEEEIREQFIKVKGLLSPFATMRDSLTEFLKLLELMYIKMEWEHGQKDPQDHQED